MDEIDQNILGLMALELDANDLRSLCLTNKRVMNKICSNNNFWRNKLYKDYPKTIGKIPGNPNFQEIYFSMKDYYIYSGKDGVASQKDEGNFYVFGRFPKGTKIYVTRQNFNQHYRTWDSDQGFLNKKDAIERIMETVKGFLEEDFENPEEVRQFLGVGPKELHGGNLEQALINYRNQLLEKDKIEFPNWSDRGLWGTPDELIYFIETYVIE